MTQSHRDRARDATRRAEPGTRRTHSNARASIVRVDRSRRARRARRRVASQPTARRFVHPTSGLHTSDLTWKNPPMRTPASCMYPVHIPPILAPSAVDLSIANAANPNPRTHRWILKSIDLARGSTRTSPSIAIVSVTAWTTFADGRRRRRRTTTDDGWRRPHRSRSPPWTPYARNARVRCAWCGTVRPRRRIISRASAWCVRATFDDSMIR